MNPKILIIVDPQIDFITGALTVPGAEEAMDKLSEYIQYNGDVYSHIIVTADLHPFNHCSFKRNGGQWPAHCIADSIGAAIWPPIMKQLINYSSIVTILHKGDNPEIEEYSILKNNESAGRLSTILTDLDVKEVDICGLAGDFCVADTVRDFRSKFPFINIRVLSQYIASIDGGKTIEILMEENK